MTDWFLRKNFCLKIPIKLNKSWLLPFKKGWNTLFEFHLSINAFCQVWLTSAQWFRRWSQTCKNVYRHTRQNVEQLDGQTDTGKKIIRIVTWAFRSNLMHHLLHYFTIFNKIICLNIVSNAVNISIPQPYFALLWFFFLFRQIFLLSKICFNHQWLQTIGPYSLNTCMVLKSTHLINQLWNVNFI